VVMSRRGLVVLLATLLIAPMTSAQRERFLGETVGSIRLSADGEIPEAELRERLRTKIGESLDLDEVARSIRSLYATGLFRNIRVDAETGPDGAVELTYVLSLHFRIEAIEFDGMPDSENAIRDAVQVRIGDVASLDAIDRAAVEMRDQLLRRGYMSATVDPAVNFERQTHTAVVTFFIEAGTRAEVASIRFEGSKEPFSDESLKEMLGRGIGRDFAVSNARRWAERLNDRLIKEGYREAGIRYEDAVFDASANSVEIVYDVDVGPLLEVSLEGTDERGVQRLIPFKKREPYSDDRLQETLEAIEEWYQKRSHFFASARADDETSDGVRTVTISVRPGDQYDLEDVVFSGADQMPDKRIENVVSAGHPNVIQRIVATVMRRKLGVTFSQLEEDRQAIESLYRTSGYLDAIVDRGRVEVTEDGSGINIVFEIYEGTQTLMTEVEVLGLLAMDRTSLPVLKAVAGQPANPVAITEDVLALQSALAEAGFAESRVSQEFSFSEDRSAARLVYRVEEGERYRYGRTGIRGNAFTDESVIRTKASSLKEGNPYSYKEVTRVQRELYQLGIFKRVAITPVTSTADPLTRDLQIEVEEGQAVRLTGSVGYSTDEKVRLRGSISHRNLFGKARYIGLDGLYSSVAERYFLTYREPFTFGRDVSTQVTVFQDDEVRDEITLDRYGVFVEASKLFSERVRYSIRYDYKVVTPFCPNLTEEECNRLFFGLQTEKQDDTIASVSQNLYLDWRDDAIDPSEGWFTRASIEYAFPAFQSTSEFVKGFAQVAWYTPVGAKATLALSGRVGLIHPLSEGDPYNAVPYSERFLAGGENSHRGYRLKKLGILGVFDDDTFTVTPDGATIRPELIDGETVYTVLGGNAMLLLNAELRYPLTETVGVTAFLDIGQIWRLISTVDLGYLKYAPGIGAYYSTPVGPIRFDLGYNIDAEEYEDTWLPFLTIGYSF
jgi:outer membrane protein assembly complex protein YaeT